MINELGNVNLDFINNSINTIKESTNKTENTSSDIFEAILDASKSSIEETNSYQLEASKMQLDFVTGKSDDVLSVMMAQESAATALNFTVQITNKIIDSYKELMQIQL